MCSVHSDDKQQTAKGEGEEFLNVNHGQCTVSFMAILPGGQHSRRTPTAAQYRRSYFLDPCLLKSECVVFSFSTGVNSEAKVGTLLQFDFFCTFATKGVVRKAYPQQEKDVLELFFPNKK